MSGFEIIGAVAAAEQFAEVLFKTIKLAKSVANQFQDGPNQIQQKIERLESLASLAKQIQNTTSLQTEDIGKILTRCEWHVQSLQDLLQKISFNCHDSIQKKTWRAITGLKQEANISKLSDNLDHEYNSLNTHINLRILAISGDIQTGYNSIDTKLNTIAQAANPSPDSLKCLQALFITDPATDRAKLINSKGELVQGTCDWIAEKKEFVEWRASDGGLLWISGGPGLGKTMLSIYLTEYLSSCFLSTDDGKTRYSTYFFCDANDNTRNNAVAIIRGILFQLLEQKKELIGHILPSYEVQREQLFSQNSFETVWKFFLTMVNDLGDSQTTCIIDGLDECEPISLELLLKNLKKITSTSPKLKIIVLSREYPQIFGASLGQFPRIRLDPDAKTEVNRGLEQYISTRVAELSESKQYTTELANHVKECLMEKSAGTYLWVSFTVKDLQTMEISEVEESLNQLPQGLDALYERIFQQVESTQRGLTLDILRWCTFTVRPLSLNELATALEIKPTGLLDSVTILRGKLAYCGHFLSITNDTVTLVHHSAYNFLTRRVPISEAMPWFSLSNVELEQSELASECISYFCDVYCRDKDAFLVETIEDYGERKLRYPFFDYAIRHWTEHFKHSGERSDKTITEYSNFFSEKLDILDSWMELSDSVRLWTTFGERESYYGEPLSGQAQLAANYGLTVLMKRVLKKEGSWRHLKDLFAKAPRNPRLQIAATKGHVPILEILLENKAHINSPDSLGRTALYCAAEYGHLPAVKMLVENGARIDCETTDDDTALNVAVKRGHYKTAQYLLACGANINGGPTATAENSPLREAVHRNRPELVKLLLEWGADDRLGTKDFEYYFARGLNIFIEYWAEKFCTTPSQFRNKVEFGKRPALHLACGAEDLPTIRTLLDPKWSVDVNRQDDDGNTALHLAAILGRLEVMRLLLTKPSVDPNLTNKWGLSPFHMALFHCNSHIVEYLYMTRNWDISPPEPNGKCRFDAIHIVIIGGTFDECVRKMLVCLVVEFGVDPELRTPRASCLDNKWHSHHLPRRGDDYARSPVDLTPEDFCYETPLSLAIQRGNVKIVEFFLEYCNIDPNAPCRGCDGATPLHVAAQSLRENIVWNLIMKWNANVNCLDNHRRTPLHSVVSALVQYKICTWMRDRKLTSRNIIMKLLIDADAQTSAMDANGCTPRDLFVSNKSFENGWRNTDRGDEFDRIIRL
ncbi:ankyrin repeat-containing domain protein [Trichoderma camerunense]